MSNQHDHPVADYLLCGWRLRSELPLPELLPWRGDGRAPDVTFRLGRACLADVAMSGKHGDLAADGSFLADEAGVARYLVRGGHEVIVETRLDPASPSVRGHLFGTMTGVLCHQQGILPLHAASLAAGGAALLVAGGRGAGKSMLAAVLARRGLTLMADDVTVIRWPKPDDPIVSVGVPCLRLPGGVLETLGIAANLVPAAGPGKVSMPGLAIPRQEPAPLAAIFHLAPDLGAAVPWMQKLTPTDALAVLHSVCFRGRLARMLGRGDAVFQAAALLASSRPNYRLWWNGDVAQLDLLADLVREGMRCR